MGILFGCPCRRLTRCFKEGFESELYGSKKLLELAQLHSELFYNELLDALVNATNELMTVVIDATQEKNERDENLRCNVRGMQKVNQDLLDALDTNRVLAR